MRAVSVAAESVPLWARDALPSAIAGAAKSRAAADRGANGSIGEQPGCWAGRRCASESRPGLELRRMIRMPGEQGVRSLGDSSKRNRDAAPRATHCIRNAEVGRVRRGWRAPDRCFTWNTSGSRGFIHQPYTTARTVTLLDSPLVRPLYGFEGGRPGRSERSSPLPLQPPSNRGF